MSDRRDDATSPATPDPSPEADSFDELLAGALPGIERLPGDQPRRIAPRRRRPPSRAAVGSAVASTGDFTVERYGETFTALASGDDPRLLDRLRGGALPPEAELDLHGHTVAAATVALDAFLARCLAEGKRCLLVIHGRGHRSAAGPVLKETVIHRLTGPIRGRPIAALATAPRRHGGPGALLVLLRRR